MVGADKTAHQMIYLSDIMIRLFIAITLVRLRNSPLQKVSEFLTGNCFLKSSPFTVDSFHLYSSQIGKNGALYTLEGIYLLGGLSHVI